MRARRAVGCAVASSLLAIAACGGKILDESALPAPSSSPTSSPDPFPGPSSGPLPPSPPTPLVAAKEIADAYCTSFAVCCKSASQPPIDIARCREITEAAVIRRAGGTVATANPNDVDVCVVAIRSRMAICSKVDADWSRTEQLELFGPSRISEACAPLIGKPGNPAVPCGAKKPCAFLQTCVIDQCTDDVGEGSPCASSACLDGLKCVSTCELQSGAGVGSPCTESRDCQLGLVCFDKGCAPARAHPDLYVERHSPYRVSFDTCRVFSFL